MRKYIPRCADVELSELLECFGAVCVEGPKWCGKTWLARNACRSEIAISDPTDNFHNRQLVNMSLDYALRGAKPRLIDEWQEVPELWDAVRSAVDNEGGRGLFILTGSSTPRTKGILHSGAGRIARMRMDTMSLYEMGRSSGMVSMRDLFEGKDFILDTGTVALEQLAEYVVTGGWPQTVDMSYAQARRIPSQYLNAVLEDDINRLDEARRDIGKIKAFVRCLARNESTMVSNQKLARETAEVDGVSISTDTVSEYLSTLSRLFLTYNQPSYSPNLRSSRRTLKAEKRHLVDPSLAAASMSATVESLCRDLQTFGFLFEALCEHDLRIYARANGGSLYHFRDDKNNEIDAIVELQDGHFGAFEVKLGAKQIDAAAAHLRKMNDILGREAISPVFLCVIIGVYGTAYRRPDGVYVVPITALKD